MDASEKYSENGRSDTANGTSGKKSQASSSSRKQSNVFMKYIRPCFAEFLVTLLFVFLGVCSVDNAKSFTPLVHGLAIMALAFLAGGIRWV